MSRPRRGMSGVGSGTPHKRQVSYSRRKHATATWVDFDTLFVVPSFSGEQNMWAATLCASIHEAVTTVTIRSPVKEYVAAVNRRAESYRWIMEDKHSLGSFIWVLEQLDFLQWASRIRQYVKERYVAQPLVAEGCLSSQYEPRRIGRPSNRVLEPHLACHTPSPKKRLEYVYRPCQALPGAQRPPSTEAKQSQSASSASDGTCTLGQQRGDSLLAPLCKTPLLG